MFLKQSTAKVISFGPFVDKTDGVTPEVGLVSALDHASTGILLSKNGGALTIRNATVTATTYDAYGNYRVTLDTTDTNTLGTLRMQFIETATCLPVWSQEYMVIPATVYDALVTNAAGGANGLPLFGSAMGITAGAIVAASFGAGAINAAAIAADAITAAKIADGAIDTATFASGTTIPRCTLVDTLTTYTGNTPQTGDSFARIGAAGAGLTAADDATLAAIAALNNLSAAQVNVECDTALTDYDAPTNAEMVARTIVSADYGTVANQTTINNNVSAVGTLVLDLPTNAELATALGTADDSLLAQVALVKAKTDLIPASPAAVGSTMTLDLTQAFVPTTATETVGGALAAARAQGFGKWELVGTTLTLYAADGTTAVRTFTLDSATAPTSRT